MEAAKYRLNVTEGLFVSTQANYTKAAHDMLEQQNKMTEIQANLAKLSQENIGLQEAKEVLESAMVLIVKVKSSITDLCRFFQSMSLTVEAIVNHSVNPFLENLQDVASVPKIGAYSLTDLQRTLIFQSAVTVKAHFSVYGDIAAMWCKLSQKYIMPGVKLLDQISLPRQNEALRFQQILNLQRWAQESSTGVQRIAEQSQRDILQGMQDRVTDIQAVTKHLPSSAPMKEAIAAGTRESQAVVSEEIESAPAAQGLKRFGMKKKMV
jgi:hypothetical protein